MSPMIRSSCRLIGRCTSQNHEWLQHYCYQNKLPRRLSPLTSIDFFGRFVHNQVSSRCFATSGKEKSISADKETASKSLNYSNERFSKIIRGDGVEFDASRRIAGLAHTSIIGKSGDSVALTNIVVATATDPIPLAMDVDNESHVNLLADALKRRCQQDNSSALSPMTVDYRQRHHAVGKIPTSANRTDNRRLSESEVLASRAIDRSLRPLLRKDLFWEKNSLDVPSSIHLSCSIQAYNGGHPVSLALNSAAVALQDRLSEPVAAIALVLMEDGTVLLNPSKQAIQAQQQQLDEVDGRNEIVGNLLYAGTKDSTVMMEFSGMVSETMLLDLIGLAHESLHPILESQEKIRNSIDELSKKGQQDDELRQQLGLAIKSDDSTASTEPSSDSIEDNEFEIKAKEIYQEASDFINSRLRHATLRLFGAQLKNDTQKINEVTKNGTVAIHSEEKDGKLLGKVVRGRREALVNEAIKDILTEFKPSDSELCTAYQKMLQHDKSILKTLGDTIHSKILRDAIAESSIVYKSRADGRGSDEIMNGSSTIRPLSIEVPALPNAVHGSALFTRGETQVLCTTTLGPPKDGIPKTDPYESTPETIEKASDTETPSKKLPVGSLRYLRSQEHLDSDLNSRKIRADREQTGDSGTLQERSRAFLQYDFPAYSKGEIQTRPAGANRREIGHSALAEKSILPLLPPPSEFPYAIRMTSEVTSSNGSSSMASICGVTLSLLDAGVPLRAPAAGVSVGLVQDKSDGSYELLLDITGTEDHFGLMDLKVGGTAEKVTALQLDVKEPLPSSIVCDGLNLAREGRIAILEEMKHQSAKVSNGAISNLQHRSELKPSAPRSSVVKFDPARKKDLLGPGGVVIRQMEDRFNVSLDLTQEGQCLLFGDDPEMVRRAKAAVMDLVSDVEVGVTYEGTIIEIRDFGVIIELLRNKEGLCHVSEIAKKEKIRNHPNCTQGFLNERFVTGQKVDVVCTAVDPVQGIIRLRPASNKESF